MTTKTDSKATSAHGLALRKTFDDVLAAVERNTALSPTRMRDLRSSVIRVADLLGNVPGRIALDLPTIATRLAAISPVAAGMTHEALRQRPVRLPCGHQGERPDADRAMA